MSVSPSQEITETLARLIWLNKGKPQGSDQNNWTLAQEILAQNPKLDLSLPSLLAPLGFSTLEDVLLNVHWTEANLEKLGVFITPKFVTNALEGFWAQKAQGATGHAKKYVPFNKEEPKWTKGALTGFVDNYSGVKDIHFGRNNLPLGLPVSHADMILRDKETGNHLMSLECIRISNYRTGWLMLTFIDLVMKEKRDMDVVVIGAGPVAEACVLLLNASAANQIKRIAVLSKGGQTNIKLVKKLQSMVQIPLVATNDRSLIAKADYLITATNAGKPVVETHEIGPCAKVLAQGINEVPADYIQSLINMGGLLIADDMEP